MSRNKDLVPLSEVESKHLFNLELLLENKNALKVIINQLKSESREKLNVSTNSSYSNNYEWIWESFSWFLDIINNNDIKIPSIKKPVASRVREFSSKSLLRYKACTNDIEIFHDDRASDRDVLRKIGKKIGYFLSEVEMKSTN